jgi:hypothetical protein
MGLVTDEVFTFFEPTLLVKALRGHALGHTLGHTLGRALDRAQGRI